MRTNVIPPIVRDVSRSLLRKLELKVAIPLNFDVLTIFNMLDVCPSLEILHLKLSPWLYNTERQQRRSYGYCSHAALKEVKIEGINIHLMTFVPSLLQTAVALRQMIIITGTSKTKSMLTNYLQEHINNSVELIIECSDF
ncbi:uncharacterized protein LOC130806626 [Amaranthus tricolor]|uniref:uncharacterized protein LOC130806626 n=1 Tax=Amaranthus tricolor TaxID=29722 RepID=UPI00258704D0|nr:uncharacterized protein LOC130806626 [Amaranthus tricolor]